LLYTDDDCIPRPDWALRMVEALSQEPVVAGAVTPSHGSFVQLCHNVAQFAGYMPCRKAGPVAFMAGANMGLRRSVLEEAGGFCEGMRCAEDMELCLRLRARGYRPHFSPDAVVAHDPDRRRLPVIFRYAMEHAATTVQLRDKHRSMLRTPFVLRSPLLLLAASPAIALVVTVRIFLGSGAPARHFYTAPVVYALKVAWCIGAARGLRHPVEVYQNA
jgi:cellulose synthase/poly-beta-1,6-N-acetylglucosamine synthase-like glycosyltransferase